MGEYYTDNLRLAPSFQASISLYTGNSITSITISHNTYISSLQKVALLHIHSKFCDECNTVDAIEHYIFSCKSVKNFDLK